MKNVHNHAFGARTVIGSILGDGVGRDVDGGHLGVAHDIRIDLAPAAARVYQLGLRGESSSDEMVESGLYQVVSIETGDDVVGGPFDLPLLAVPVLIPHVA